MTRFFPGHHEELSLVARGRYSSLRPEATTIEKSQICRICQIPPQLVMAEGHTILKLQELFSTCTVNMVLLLQPIAVRRRSRLDLLSVATYTPYLRSYSFIGIPPTTTQPSSNYMVNLSCHRHILTRGFIP